MLAGPFDFLVNHSIPRLRRPQGLIPTKYRNLGVPPTFQL